MTQAFVAPIGEAATPAMKGSDRAESRAGASAPTVSVVVATRARPQLLERCLSGVATQDFPPTEVIVVDNTLGDDATRDVAHNAAVQYLVEPLPGVSRARNRGALAAAGDIVAFIDDDALPRPAWLGALAAEFADPRVVAVAGLTVAFPAQGGSDGRRIFGGPERIALDRDSANWFERASFGGIVRGCNFAVRRSAWETWPGFDARLGAGTAVGGMEEHHAFFELIALGHRVVYTPAAQVHHPALVTTAELKREGLRDVRAASFFLALVIAEHPRLRRRAAKYALEALRETPRLWRLAHVDPAISRTGRARSALRGVVLYLASRRDSHSRERRTLRRYI